jgi:hypothetical protein
VFPKIHGLILSEIQNRVKRFDKKIKIFATIQPGKPYLRNSLYSNELRKIRLHTPFIVNRLSPAQHPCAAAMLAVFEQRWYTRPMKKLPIGLQDFKEIITEGYVYVDKTRYIHAMLTQGKNYFMSRPRRFGKTLTVSTHLWSNTRKSTR